jgi:trigger factor
MNVSLKKNDAKSGIIKIEVVKADYEILLSKNLQKLRQKVDMHGFRKGMVPLGLVKKMYGKHALSEEINNLVSESLYSYIKDNDIKVLGEPIPNKTEQKEMDFDTGEDFEFCFDIAISPEINISLSKDDKLNFYKITVDDELIDKHIDSYLKNYGSYDKVETIEAEEDMVKGVLVELEDGNIKDGGILVEEAIVMPSYMKGKTEKKKLINASLNEKVVFNPFKAYKGAESELSSLLKIDKEKIKDVKNDFSFEIKEIVHHKKAELNQELFDQVFGEGAVNDEESFRNKIKESLIKQFIPDSDAKFMKDVRTLILNKLTDTSFADDILKRWLLLSNEESTEDTVDKDYSNVVEDLKYHLAKEKLSDEYAIKVEKEDIVDFAKIIVRSQFAKYGMLSVSDHVLENYAKDMLKKQEMVNNIVNHVMEVKLYSALKDKISVEEKELTIEEFEKLNKKEK